MKTKITLGVVAIALVALLIAGGTSSWFTAEADVPEVEFTAGTLIINVDDTPAVEMESGAFNNVNPGDEAEVCWNIVNNGTKSAELRVLISGAWSSGLSGEVVSFSLPEGSKWKKHTDGHYYYTAGPVAGTYGDNVTPEDRTVKLCLLVSFDGEEMDNEYQGESYTISGTVEAIQSTNGAAEAVWGE